MVVYWEAVVIQQYLVGGFLQSTERIFLMSPGKRKPTAQTVRCTIVSTSKYFNMRRQLTFPLTSRIQDDPSTN